MKKRKMELKKYKISENEYLTLNEIKEKILSYKNPEPDEKLTVRDPCCICLRTINSWFHGQGRTCSSECNFIYNKTFGSGEDVFKTKDEEVRKWIGVRSELWRRRGWVYFKDSNKVIEWFNKLPNNEKDGLFGKVRFNTDDMDEPEFICYLITRMLYRWKYENNIKTFDEALNFLKSEKGEELRLNIFNSLIEENIKHLENLSYPYEKVKMFLDELRNK